MLTSEKKWHLCGLLCLVLIAGCLRAYPGNSPWGYLLLSEETTTSASTSTTATVESYSEVILAESSLLAYWRLNESANPVADSKSSNDGALTGAGTPTSAAGATSDNDADNGLCLNDTDTFRVVVPNNSALEFTAGNSITLEAWFKPNVLNPKMTLLSQGRTTGTENSNYTLRVNGAKIGFFFGDAGSASTAVYRSDDYIFKPDNWYHVALTHTYGSISNTEIYINGVQRNGSWILGAGTETPDVAGEALWIGASDGPGAGTVNNVLGGCVDEVAIYNSILAINDLRKHYRVAKNRLVKLLPAKNVLGASDALFLDIVGGSSPYTFSIVSGSGTISSSGNFTAPATMGATVVRVTDTNGSTDDVTLTAYQEPDDIANLQVWLKADSLSLADAAAITVWSDGSGNGNDATSTTFDPDFSEGIQNGLPAAVFTAANSDRMALPGITWDPSTQVFSVLAVFSVSLTTGNHEVILQQTGGGRRILWVNNVSMFPQARVNGTSAVHSVATATNTGLQYSIVWDLANLELYNLGTQVATQAVTADSFTNAWRIGSSAAPNQFLNGGLAELILFDTNLSAANRQALECYLGEKYNFSIDSANACP